MTSVKHPPNMAATVLTQLVASAKLPQMLQISIDEQLVRYVDSVAACERLQKQPIPVAYTRYAGALDPEDKHRFQSQATCMIDRLQGPCCVHSL